MAAIQIPGAQRGVPLPVVGPVNWWIVAGLLVFGASAMLPVFQNSMATSRGFDTQKLQLQQTHLRNDIKLLEVDVVETQLLCRNVQIEHGFRHSRFQKTIPHGHKCIVAAQI